MFYIFNAKSKGFEDHEGGKISFISNGFTDNGVIGYVEPLKDEKIFRQNGICVSAFCEATVQRSPYLPRGNGGSGLTILIPKSKNMLEIELYWYASLINAKNWRFSFGRMVTGNRLSKLEIYSPPKNLKFPINLSKLVPNEVPKIEPLLLSELKLMPIDKFFTVEKGTGKYYENCKNGSTPLISASSENNGIVGFVDLAPTVKAPAVTIERVSGSAFLQLEDFATVPDDVFVLKPKKPMQIEELFYILAMLNRQKWKFNYSRKVTPTRLEKISIPIPTQKGNVDIEYMKRILKSTYGWDMVN